MIPYNYNRLTVIPGDFRKAGYDPVPDYLKIKNAALNCVFPAEQISGRWYYDVADLHLIAAALGLSRSETPALQAA